MRKPFFAAAALLAGLFAILYLAFSQETPVSLVPIEEPPRPQVRADPRSTHIMLSGHLARETDKSNTARRARNALVKKHAEALAAWRAGARPLREVEAIEMDLQVARHRVGEISDVELHGLLAGLYQREVERLEALFAMGAAGRDHVDQARLYVARERHLAGEPAADYEAQRVKFLADTKQRHQRLADLGLGNREHLQLEYETLEEEFGPLDAP